MPASPLASDGSSRTITPTKIAPPTTVNSASNVLVTDLLSWITYGLAGQSSQSDVCLVKRAGRTFARIAINQTAITVLRSSFVPSRPSGKASMRWTNAARNRLPAKAPSP